MTLDGTGCSYHRHVVLDSKYDSISFFNVSWFTIILHPGAHEFLGLNNRHLWSKPVTYRMDDVPRRYLFRSKIEESSDKILYCRNHLGIRLAGLESVKNLKILLPSVKPPPLLIRRH